MEGRLENCLIYFARSASLRGRRGTGCIVCEAGADMKYEFPSGCGISGGLCLLCVEEHELLRDFLE